MRSIKVLVPLIAIVAVVALAGAVVAITKKPKSYTSQIHQLQTQLASADSEISGLKADSQAGRVATLQSNLVGLQTKIGSLDSTIASFKICIPELEQQVNGESISTNSSNGWLTSAYIDDPTIISSNCQKLLNGAQS